MMPLNKISPRHTKINKHAQTFKHADQPQKSHLTATLMQNKIMISDINIAEFISLESRYLKQKQTDH